MGYRDDCRNRARHARHEPYLAMSHRLDRLLISEDGPLPVSHWNFTSIADDELIACCLWEYARESRTLALASAVHQMNTRRIRRDDAPEPKKDCSRSGPSRMHECESNFQAPRCA